MNTDQLNIPKLFPSIFQSFMHSLADPRFRHSPLGIFLLRVSRAMLKQSLHTLPEADYAELEVLGVSLIIAQSVRSIEEMFLDTSIYKPHSVHTATNAYLGAHSTPFGLTAPSCHLDDGGNIVFDSDYRHFEDILNPKIRRLTLSQGAITYLEKLKIKDSVVDLDFFRKVILVGFLAEFVGHDKFLEHEELDSLLNFIIKNVDNVIPMLTAKLLRANLFQTDEQMIRNIASSAKNFQNVQAVEQVWEVITSFGISEDSLLNLIMDEYESDDHATMAFLMIEAGVGSTAHLALNALKLLHTILSSSNLSEIPVDTLKKLVYVAAFLNPPIDLTLRNYDDAVSGKTISIMFSIAGAAKKYLKNARDNGAIPHVIVTVEDLELTYNFLKDVELDGFPWLRFEDMSKKLVLTGDLNQDLRLVRQYFIRNCSGETAAVNSVVAILKFFMSKYDVGMGICSVDKVDHISSSSGPKIRFNF